MPHLERAIAIAVEGHAGQLDKAGRPYILHPLRVMLSIDEETAQIVAVLHDVVEDCAGWSFDRLRREGFNQTVIAALDSVTKRNGEDYSAFVARAGRDRIGRIVKLADLQDNSDLTRLPDPTPADLERMAKYRHAIATLKAMA